MSISGDQISITYIKQSVKGTIPAGNFTVFRREGSESLSGSPMTKESGEVTGNVLPTGQLITGLDVKGDLSGELAPTKSHYDFIASAMRSAWANTCTTGNLVLTINTSTNAITRAAGSFVTDGFKVNDMVQLKGFTNAVNNTTVTLTAVSATSVTYVGAATMVNETGPSTSNMVRPNYVELGSTDSYFTIEKKFGGLTNASILYQDLTVDQMNIDLKWGEIAKIKFSSVGMGNNAWTSPATPFTNSRTIDAVATENALNCSSDIGVILVDGAATSYCIEGLGLTVNAGRQSANCLGYLAAQDKPAMQFSVDISMDVMVDDGNFALHGKRMSQTPISIQYFVQNDTTDLGYAFHIPAAQLAFDDASGSKGQIAKLSMKGKLKADATMGNALRIYKLT